MHTLRSNLRLLSHNPRSIGIVLLGWMLMAAGLIQAEEAVPFPKLPEGAGEIDSKAAKTLTTTESGLKYRILRQGSGTKPTPVQRVQVNYQGWLFNGRVCSWWARAA
ncbi:MAG: hypothetical protein B7Z37_09450 [Verrucomicrobia bacterium 12-59-8]|nr:MAG: hypothetical protein B7Z37_09450 [Verrucomicrobia bacterium 12-59-8]